MLKQKGLVNGKEDFWLSMDLKDLDTAGAFISKELWGFISHDEEKVQIKPTDYTKRR